jgi:protein-tyrosine phosphatase
VIEEAGQLPQDARPAPVDADRMPSIAGIDVPKEIYLVLERPARLAGMIRPTARTPWSALADEGFRYVVCLTDDVAPYDPSPLSVLHAVGLEDLYGGLTPKDTKRESEKIIAAAEETVSALREGHGVVVHCAGGTGRTGSVIGVVLRMYGHSADDVRAYLDRLHRQRGSGWPESFWPATIFDRIGAL